MSGNDNYQRVEVCYALAGHAHLISVLAPPGATVRDVIEQSGIQQRCPEINLEENRVGIFSSLRELDERVTEGDRIEIYRPLQVEPGEARRRRAKKQQGERN